MNDASAEHVYAIALGSNRRHGRFGSPKQVIGGALDALRESGVAVVAESAVIVSDAIGPSLRRYANAAALIETVLPPPALLARLKSVERNFGRRPGQRWGARVLDIDIILWSGGIWADTKLSVPHPHWRERVFVTAPLASIAPGWRDPVARRTIRQIARRLTAPQPVDPASLNP